MNIFFKFRKVYLGIFLLPITLQPIYSQQAEIGNKVVSEKSASKEKTKDWNFMVYIASNNDLHEFSTLNIEQMKTIGSNNHINILVQQDTHGKKEISRYFVEKKNLVLKETKKDTEESTSGTSKSLYKFAEWAIKNYSAKHNILVLWNHGSGIEDPSIWGKKGFRYPNDIFVLNPKTGLIEIDRDTLKLKDPRGIAFNEFFKTYLTNQDLKQTLSKISRKLLGGKKIDILAMDACNMAMLEVGTQIKDSVNYMVASEEAEPATGWNYSLVLKPFTKKSLSPKEFAIQIVSAYKEEYEFSYADYTQSAVKLTDYSILEENINDVAICLLNLLENKDKETVFKQIKKIRRSKKLTTILANKNYIDMHHFYSSTLKKMQKYKNKIEDKITKTLLISLLQSGLTIIENQVIATITCENLEQAWGLSIYYPQIKIHKSYPKTAFVQSKNKWFDFLQKYTKEQHLIKNY